MQTRMFCARGGSLSAGALALDGLDLRIEAGETYGLLGPDDAG